MKRIVSENQSVRITALFLVSVFLVNDCISFASNLGSIRDFNKKTVSKAFSLPLIQHTERPESKAGSDGMSESFSREKQQEFMTMMRSMAASNPTSGSSGFSIGSTDGMVDKFTGDFSYSIPLMDVDGYPLALTYNSNVGMMSEASWVGLGWDLNVGSVNRQMRGIPDEFNGSQNIVRKFNQRNGDNPENNPNPNHARTDGWKAGGYLAYSRQIPLLDTKLFNPGLQVTALWGKYTSPYVGQGKTFDFGLQASFSLSDDNETMNIQPSFGLGYSRDSKNGIGLSKNIGLEGGFESKNNYAGGGVTFGNSFNSRKGIIDKSFGLTLEASESNTKASFSSSTSLSFGTATSIPRVMFDQNSHGHITSYDLYASYKTGNNIFSAGFMYNNYWSYTDLIYNDANKQIFQPAYGYLHSAKRENHPDDGTYPVMDYERTRDFAFSENMKNLSFSTQTFDIFNVSASGIGGTFRAGRTDYGTFYDPRTKNTHNASSELLIDDNIDQVALGVMIRPGRLSVEGTYATGTMKGEMKSANWKYGASNLLTFEPEANSSFFDNTAYFKQVGEQTPTDLDAYAAMGFNSAKYFDVNVNGDEIQLTNQLLPAGGTLNSALNSLDERPVRATQFLPKLADDYETGAVFLSHNTNNTTTAIPRKDGVRLGNHISSIDVISTDGTSYTYGIPVYSLDHAEVTFAVSATGENSFGLVNYSNAENSINNTSGIDHYYDRTTMPAYPTEFLLTEMKSSDYIDRMNDGPTLDDIGNYYHFNYYREYSTEDPFHWRFPISADNSNAAFYNEGLQGTELDNMANYTVGKKEIWYLQSIETKNYLVKITLDPTARSDGHGAGENGQINSDHLRSVQKIELFNRNEALTNSNAIPLQTVLFTYDYSLCKHDPSNSSGTIDASGKLTLLKVQVFTGNSFENALKSYDFTYEQGDVSNYFAYNKVDGWGNFKANNSQRPNSFYPYAEQDEPTADEAASLWKLIKIENPQGGSMEIFYEADRYGYVQNKRAMQHLKVHRMTNLLEFLHIHAQSSWNGTAGTYDTFNRAGFDRSGVENYVYSLPGYTSAESERIADIIFKNKGLSAYYSKFEDIEEGIYPNNVIIFPLEEWISAGLTKEEAGEEVKEKYFMQNGEQLKQLFLKTDVNVKTSVRELVPSFASISEACNSVFHSELNVPEQLVPIGVMPANGGSYQYGYVVLDLAVSGNKESKHGSDNGGIALHPLQKAALEFARINLADKVYGACVDCEGDLTVDKNAIFGADIYKNMILNANYARTFNPVKSLVRLYDADNVKFGGNSRVRRIVYKDNWLAQSNEYTSSYQWDYAYEQLRPAKTYGVASFEPKQILDENPFYMWDSYANFNEKFPDETNFNPTPISDALFPNPIVGYEEVRVLFSGNAEKGFSSSKFHTNKELAYVTQEKKTNLDKNAVVTRTNILLSKTVDLFGYTQGYFVQTNDFHGKADEMAVYDKNNNLQSRSKYHYYGLGEKVPVMDREGIIEEKNIAVEFDMHNDSRFVIDDNKALVAGLKISVQILPVPGPPMFRPRFSISSRENGFYSNTLIKHINYSAVVKSIETETLGSINTAENMIYDRFSGNVIVSSLKDEFNDKLYSINYPSHWYYDELKELTDMEGRQVQLTLTSAASFTQVDHILTPGDLIRIGSGTYRVAKYGFDTNDAFFLIKESGALAGLGAGTYTCTILHCHRDNRLGETMQNVTTKKNPLSGLNFTFPTDEIISAGCLTYRDKLNVRCGEPCEKNSGHNNNEVEPDAVINPYQYGTRGDLVTDGQYAWQSERSQSHNYGVRFNGTYADFEPFYRLNATTHKWYKLSQSEHPGYSALDGIKKWRKLGEVTLFDPYGNPLESRDQIDVFSSVLYGYNSTYNLVPVASAVNARMQDIAFDGFEDYTYYLADCMVSQGHFDFKDQIDPEEGVSLEKNLRHSGLTSLKLEPSKVAHAIRVLSASETKDCITPEEMDERDNIFEIESCDCIKTFDPLPGDYIVSLWVKKDETNEDAGVSISFTGPGSPGGLAFRPEGPVIEGWQRIEGQFTVSSTVETMRVTLFNHTSTPAYFDDIRIHPFLAGMTTVVYDPKTLLPMATHDGYNFTTFYNYDENLQQSRVKVETTEGIKTIIESENGGKIKY